MITTEKKKKEIRPGYGLLLIGTKIILLDLKQEIEMNIPIEDYIIEQITDIK